MDRKRSYLFTSESVTEGHPDKMCDQVSDALLDAVLEKEARLEETGYVDPDTGKKASAKDARVAIETLMTTGTVVIAGEVRTSVYIDVQDVVRETIRRIGYDRAKYGFDCDTCGILNLIHEQSPDIAQGVDESYDTQAGRTDDPLDMQGAGDQGTIWGYACNETASFMPMPIHLAHRLAERLAQVRKDGTVPYLRPDGKTQVTVRYEDDKPVEVTCVVVSTQHAAGIKDMSVVRQDMVDHVIAPVFESEHVKWDGAEILVNPTGRFEIGGPQGDTGLTSRKLIVDTYGGKGRFGGGGLSGKDPSKVDRSAAYATRWVAKNIVAAGLADECDVQVSYAIGVARPLSVLVDTHGTASVPEEVIEEAVSKVFDLRPAAIIRDLELLRPIYSKTAAYGHFGREDPDFAWERTDRAAQLAETVKELLD
jgi:S-adenosylmethionine synthetase